MAGPPRETGKSHKGSSKRHIGGAPAITKKIFKYVFGPVPSRRLGRSLGIDVVPYKTCTYDCIYCQLGRTTNRTIVRQPFVSPEEVLKELKEKLSSGVEADYITLSGSGEPTLHSEIGSIIDGIKKTTKVPVAVLTNGSLFWLPEVRRSLLNAEVVMPSLDAATPEIFKRINHPHPDIDFEKMFNGLASFRKEFKGRLWLEIFFVAGINDGEDEVLRMVECVEKIGPDRVDLNTAVRPPADPAVKAVNSERLKEIASRFKCPTEVIADAEISAAGDQRGCMEDILGMLSRRPCTVDDISKAFNLNRNEVIKHLEILKAEGNILTEERSGKLYYMARR